MSILEHDKLVELEEVLDWDAARVLPEIVADPTTMKELEEAELFRAAMEGESTPREGFTDEVMRAIPTAARSESSRGLIMLNGLRRGSDVLAPDAGRSGAKGRRP